MGLRNVLAVAAVAALGAFTTTTHAAATLECRQPNYVTRDGKIYAEDPANPGTDTEITIRGVSWSGMEKDNMIPDGLWGATVINSAGIQGTKMSFVLEFLKNQSINSVRVPLNADSIIKNSLPQVGYMHAWENRELTSWAKNATVTYLDLLGRLVETLQTNKVSVLLDIKVLSSNTTQDKFWYSAPYVAIEQSPTYLAVSALASTLCSADHWNVLGIELKDEMSDVLWNANAADADKTNDWRGAAQILANRITSLCPSWLVFVGGASSPTNSQRFSVATGYKTLSNHWDGGNLKNVTKNPLAVNANATNKIVFAPHAHSHGRFPQNYFYTADSNCTDKNPIEYFGFEYDQFSADCIDFINGRKHRSKFGCSSIDFGCSTYKHLSVDALKTQYKNVLNEAMGDVVKEGKIPVIFGSFSGVYEATNQPHQTAALDALIDYAATRLRGGYYFALNPDTEHFLEDSTNVGSGLFGRTHYGIFTMYSWQEANAGLLEALAKLPSSEIPCYGGKAKPGTTTAAPNAVVATWTGLVVSAVVAAVLTI